MFQDLFLVVSWLYLCNNFICCQWSLPSQLVFFEAWRRVPISRGKLFPHWLLSGTIATKEWCRFRQGVWIEILSAVQIDTQRLEEFNYLTLFHSVSVKAWSPLLCYWSLTTPTHPFSRWQRDQCGCFVVILIDSFPPGCAIYRTEATWMTGSKHNRIRRHAA